MSKKYYGELEYPYYFVYEKGKQAPVYWAGNSKYDSKQVVSKKDGLDSDTMQRYCSQTGMDIAEENNGEWLGIVFASVKGYV